jgi:hypothetical protein
MLEVLEPARLDNMWLNELALSVQSRTMLALYQYVLWMQRKAWPGKEQARSRGHWAHQLRLQSRVTRKTLHREWADKGGHRGSNV